ncbi:MAG TPA: tyrosine-type recombinase/integrase [Polyangia bacterium]|nr:tyrosine-type recombinase/integrase [Polyangia bacterium]
MASVFMRPGGRFYARVKDDRGRWISKRVRQQTRKDAMRVARALEAQYERIRLGLEAPPQRGELVGPLMKRWASSLTNRSAATDVGRLNLHVLPAWQGVRVADVDLPGIMSWLDAMADQGEIGPGSRRHCLGLLSRFMSWAVARGHAPRNACRDIPAGSRPRPIAPPPESVPWLRDDADVLRVMRALPPPFDIVFYLGNRCGLRLGEILGLRIGDVADLEAGAIRVAHSYDGPLKEDRHGVGKAKWVPAPVDAAAVVGPIVAARLAAGAGPDDLLLVGQDGDPLDRHQVGHRWRVVRKALNLPAGLSFYKASRHSFASRALASGASADAIAEALGHASPAITRAHYLHHVNKTFSPILRAGLGLDGAPGAKVIPMAPHAPVTAEQQGGPQQVAGKGDADAA